MFYLLARAEQQPEFRHGTIIGRTELQHKRGNFRQPDKLPPRRP
ncbi:hypothetical protein [Bradyrhizobium sp. STM 3809]|nr:hypothetical protein [Bradyrhizobium sp. STM 3809]CCE03390.1 hypothetical protein BRAS3809_7310004 [Bradyrhizobium sp. STM 3809]